MCALVPAAPAGASIVPTTNVPYLAWLGQQARIGQCVPFDHELSPQELGDVEAILSPVSGPGTFALEDWSGATGINMAPIWLNGTGGTTTVVPMTVTASGLCWYANLTSLRPGLAVVKLAVSAETLAAAEAAIGNLGIVLLADTSSTLRRQALVVFMTLGAPVLTNLGPSTFVAGDTGTELKAVVKGTFPLGNDFAGMVPGDLVTLPDQWATLANLLAIDANGSGAPGSAAMEWDIHDDTLPTSGHVPGACGTGTASVDAVDNCLGGATTGPFSFTVGGAGLVSGVAAYGPYDPLYADDTFLGDGKLDAGDAPMPAVRVDFMLAGNETAAGSLTEVSKAVAYSRDGTGASDPANLFAPYYEAYLPAAGPSGVGRQNGSGVAGTFANNFPGFIDAGVYAFWNLQPFVEAAAAACHDGLGNPYVGAGVTHAMAYSDEHGESRVHFAPNRIPLTPDAQDLCDLGPADGVAQPGGTAAVTARSIYPDQPVLWEQSNKNSNPVAMTVQEKAGASLACVLNGIGVSYCFARVLDLAGAPVAGAQVRFTRSPLGTIEAAAVAAGGYDSSGQTEISATADEVVLATNAQGTAGVHIVPSTSAPIVAQAELLGTRWTPASVGVTRSAPVPVDPLVFDQVAETVPPGDTVSTDPLGTGPTPESPVETAVTTPTGGEVTVVARTETPTGPVGYSFLDQQVIITAPAESPESPLQLVFQLDASVLGGANPSTVAIFRNGVLVPDCTGAPGAADPDPCVASRTALPGGGAEFTVLTSAASTWTFARPVPCVGPPPAGAILRGSGNDTINGTPGDDVIVDAGGNNTINGNGGNDIICSGRGNDRIDGGVGNDASVDAGGNNDVRGGDGADSITTGSGNDTIDSGPGNDSVDAAGGNNAVKTGDGADSIRAGSGNDTIDSGAGNDTIDAAGGNNAVKAGDGADSIAAGSGNDTIDGGPGNDSVDAGNGNNQVTGGDGEDGITAGSGNDNVDGGPAFDTCHPGTGKNTVKNCEA